MWLCMKWHDMVHGCMVYKECAETAAVPHGISHVPTNKCCKYTTLADIQNTLWKVTVTHLESNVTRVQRVCSRVENSPLQKCLMTISSICWIAFREFRWAAAIWMHMPQSATARLVAVFIFHLQLDLCRFTDRTDHQVREYKNSTVHNAKAHTPWYHTYTKLRPLKTGKWDDV